MLENINLKDFPKSSGVYWILDENNVVVYVGSSNNLYKRMSYHRGDICNGGLNHGLIKKSLYQFLQSNQFTVEFQLEEDYLQLEQELIEKYNPKFNQVRAYTGILSEYRPDYEKLYREKYKEERKQWFQEHKEEKKQYDKQYRDSHKEESKQYRKQYYELHKEEIKQYYETHIEEIKQKDKQYYNQKCLYNGEILNLGALKARFQRQGIEHPNIEAKKYLIS